VEYDEWPKPCCHCCCSAGDIYDYYGCGDYKNGGKMTVMICGTSVRGKCGNDSSTEVTKQTTRNHAVGHTANTMWRVSNAAGGQTAIYTDTRQ
jgi:hypothetical protein